MMKLMTLKLSRQLFIVIGFIALASIVLATAWSARSKSTETRSKASGPTAVNTDLSTLFELPVTEIGTVIRINSVGMKKPAKPLAQKSVAVLGEETSASGSSISCQCPDGSICPNSDRVLCPGSTPPPICWTNVYQDGGNYSWRTGCKGNPQNANIACTDMLVPLTTDEITGYNQWVSNGKPQIPNCFFPTPTPLQDACYGKPDGSTCQIADGCLPCSGPICPMCANPPPGTCQNQTCIPDFTLTPTTTQTPTPTSPPGGPEYGISTKDGRVYTLLQPQYRCPGGINCIEKMPTQMNFSDYLGQTVLAEGFLKRIPSRNDMQFSWWPFPPNGQFEVKQIHTAASTPFIERPEAIPYVGTLSPSTDKYVSEQVYFLPDFRKCMSPVCGPKFVRSSSQDLSTHVNEDISLYGDLYTVDGSDTFLDVSKMTPPIPTPTCRPFPVECLNQLPQEPNPNAGIDYCTAVRNDMTGFYCPPPCTPIPYGITICMSQGKTFDDCTATMGVPSAPWCRPSPSAYPTPPGCFYQDVQCIKAPCQAILICPSPIPPQDICTNQPEGSQCWTSNCPPPPPCTGPGPCVSQACPMNPGICRNGRCTQGTASICNGQPDGSDCTISRCPPQMLRRSFGNLDQSVGCRQTSGICEHNECVKKPVPTSSVACNPADFNKDGTVDTKDYAILMFDFLKNPDMALYPEADMNHDQIIDISDYSLFVKDFGTVTGPCL